MSRVDAALLAMTDAPTQRERRNAQARMKRAEAALERADARRPTKRERDVLNELQARVARRARARAR